MNLRSLRWAGLAGTAALLLGLHGAPRAATLTYLGQQIVPTGLQFAGTTVGGLSGIDFNAATGRYIAISDDRSQFNPARFYELSLDLNAFTRSATPGSAGVVFNSVTSLRTPSGSLFPDSSVDPESVRIRQGANGTTLLWSNEGLRSGTAYQNPTLREARLDGSHVRDFTVPASFYPVGTAAGTTANDSGIRNNLAFESLTLSTDGTRAYVATENALVQDGPAAAVGAGSPSRVAEFNLASGERTAEYVYQVEPVAAAPTPGGFATNGLVELLAIGERQFLAVERSFSDGAGNSIRLYLADATAASNVAGLGSLQGASFTAMSKTLLLDLGTLRNDDGSALVLDNVEGITWGADVNGQRTLVLVADNNFAATQATQFIAIGVDGDLLSPVPEPATQALMLLGLGGVAVLARRRAQR